MKITKEQWEAMTPEERQEIERKCKESPAYFYNNFWKAPNAREITDEEMRMMQELAKNSKAPRGRKFGLESLPNFLKK